MNASDKIPQQQGSSAMQPQGPSGSAPQGEESLDSKRHSRSYNPVDDAERGNVSQKLNADSAKYKQGAGPV